MRPWAPSENAGRNVAETVWPWGNGGHVRVTHKPTRRRKPAPDPVLVRIVCNAIDFYFRLPAGEFNHGPGLHWTPQRSSATQFASELSAETAVRASCGARPATLYIETIVDGGGSR